MNKNETGVLSEAECRKYHKRYQTILTQDGKKMHRGREQACACPPAQIPTCALTHGAPASDDDERPLVRPRALKPVAVARETPTQGRHRKCVLHYLNRQCRVSFPPTSWVLIPRGLYRIAYPEPLGRQCSECRTPFRFLFAAFRIRSAAMTLSPQTEYCASFSLPDSPLLRPFAPLTPQGVG